ncbi:unnamed protein product [Eruca vesicaria subsp. sativa]|uniref:Terpene synthase metal-binding domain-containing protein n=1 Tax=Eruca vesicaria subsp. sativa TaxID=29727 RepID=A0ABC8KLZ5_ERUVS|nr:unnamed protein product [Eruca vesicaria subsp. sativa]
MEIGSSSPGLDGFAAYGYISMDDCDQKQLHEWLKSKPKIFEALNTAFRLNNDIATFEEGDAFGHPDQNLTDIIASLFLHPIPFKN